MLTALYVRLRPVSPFPQRRLRSHGTALALLVRHDEAYVTRVRWVEEVLGDPPLAAAIARAELTARSGTASATDADAHRCHSAALPGMTPGSHLPATTRACSELPIGQGYACPAAVPGGPEACPCRSRASENSAMPCFITWRPSPSASSTSAATGRFSARYAALKV